MCERERERERQTERERERELLFSGHCLQPWHCQAYHHPLIEAEAHTLSPMNIQPVIQTSEGMSGLVHSTGEATLPTVNILCSPQNKGHKWRMFSGTLFCPSPLSVKDDARMIRLHVVGDS